MIDFLLKNKELITILSGLGTFISALIAIWTLREVKKQRLSLYQPDVLIKSFIVAISKSPLLLTEDELLRYKTGDFNDYSCKYEELMFNTSPMYKLNNFGFGIAKNVKCKWEFDTPKAIKALEALMPNQYQFSFYKDLQLYFLNSYTNENFQLSIDEKSDLQVIDFISPINVQEHSHLHTIPSSIVLTHYLFLLFQENLTGISGENFHVFEFSNYSFPKPVLHLEFTDLNSKRYWRKFKFEISAIITQTEDQINLTEEFSYLQFELK